MSPDELPALAFGSHYSVFKERPGTHQSSRCWCRVCRRTVPDDCFAGESPSAAGGPGRPFRRVCHCSRRVTERQRAAADRIPPGRTPDRPLPPIVAGHPPSPRMPARTVRFPTTQPAASRTGRWHAVSHPALRMPPGARSSTGFPPPPCRHQGRRERAPPADVLDLPHVTTIRWQHDAPRLLHGCDRAVTPDWKASFDLIGDACRRAPVRAATRRGRPAPRSASASPSPP